MKEGLVERFGAPAILLTVVILSVSIVAGQALAQTVESFRDDFSGISYSGNNGTLSWSGSWRESGEGDGPSAGSVRVVDSDRCAGGVGRCLRIGSEGGNLSNHGVARTADLENAQSATLSYHYRRQTQGKATGTITVQISGNGGSSWSTLSTISFQGSQNAATATHDISGYTASNTTLRFRGSGSGITGYVYFDAIEVVAEMVQSTTTTTTAPPTTTTTAPAATTTTTPVSSTTTTAAQSTSTTTDPGSSTTTTVPTVALSAAPSTTVPSDSGATSDEVADVPDTPRVDAAGESPDLQDGASDNQGPALASIALDAASGGAVTGILLLALMAGLVIAGIDRKRE
ncbi:MAG: hypothetical protein ABFR95_03470 [Actinomycetota bacterium]